MRDTLSGKYHNRGGEPSYVIDRDTDKVIDTHGSLADAEYYSRQYNEGQNHRRYKAITIRKYRKEAAKANSCACPTTAQTKDEIAVNAIRNAAETVHELCEGVDPGHIPIIKYLERLHRELRRHAIQLEQRCREESGS
jgi:hypothetical protein